ncbi:Rv3654c family TadE-like protein [Nocardia harenae]|uniref:Rv3654c family TadE-like protein n=1 Tax=Nocardia harenae TaxID=358707 RepID=UPI00082EECB0|nr:Rv3654c family TadE-like protein [Nocardia harenae]
MSAPAGTTTPVENARGGRGSATQLARRPRRGVGAAPGSPSAERGSATITTCFAVLTLLALTAMLTHLGATITARHRVQSTADLAALAAAAALIEGPVAGCAAADALSTRAGTRLRECTVDQWDVTVVAEVQIPLGLFGVRFASAAARAGPVEKIE